MRSVEIEGETYYLRRFTVRDYRLANINPDDTQGAMVAMLAMSLAKDDGTRRFLTVDDAREFVDELPFAIAVKLSTEITDLNGLQEKKPES